MFKGEAGQAIVAIVAATYRGDPTAEAVCIRRPGMSGAGQPDLLDAQGEEGDVVGPFALYELGDGDIDGSGDLLRG